MMCSYRGSGREAWQDFKRLMTFMLAVGVILFVIGCCTGGCAALRTPPVKYVPGENHDRSGVSCGTRCTVEADFPPCN